ncbi:hypothetical protein N7470_000048 [Penicillium chermesinum]|nr:hypothetical protein N7470_000048 [Penicillium chermesinum]
MTSLTTVASLESVQLLSEASYGCEHLAAVLGGSNADQFKRSFCSQYESLAPYTKPEAVAVQTTGLRTVSSLKPKYHCLTCSEICLSTERRAHTKSTGHVFYLESRNRYVFCESCADFVYDHGLERLAGPMAKYEADYGKAKWVPDAASDAYVKNNANKNPCSRRGARGVWNMGQTCYQAVILQALLHDPSLNAYFLAGGHDIHTCERSFCMACAAAEVFMDFNSGEKTEAVSAATLSPMAGTHPGESYEEKCQCFFHKTFYGELRSSVMCHKCGKTTHTYDPMADLSLDVQLQNKKRKLGARSATSLSNATLVGCLESFTAVEDLHADAAYHCEKCGNTPQRASKRLQIHRLPAILCMQLKRYEHNSTSSEKVNGHIDFPLTLNMLPYTVKKDKERVDTSRYIYDLSTVVVHQGTMDSGHYFAYTRVAGDKWVLMDDNKVTVASVADVLRQDAYLLFYGIRSIEREELVTKT